MSDNENPPKMLHEELFRKFLNSIRVYWRPWLILLAALIITALFGYRLEISSIGLKFERDKQYVTKSTDLSKSVINRTE